MCCAWTTGLLNGCDDVVLFSWSFYLTKSLNTIMPLLVKLSIRERTYLGACLRACFFAIRDIVFANSSHNISLKLSFTLLDSRAAPFRVLIAAPSQAFLAFFLLRRGLPSLCANLICFFNSKTRQLASVITLSTTQIIIVANNNSSCQKENCVFARARSMQTLHLLFMK